jgi:hypothetical protein
MFELDHDLAQDIVNRTMAILPYNVNVMDSQGLILGSGEQERINTRHEGAQLVLANGRVVEIDSQTAKHLKGVAPGINLPLLHDQRLIGVLGISGEPQLLRTYAELVRMTAEMLVSQRHQQAEQQWRRQRCDDLLALLLADSGESPRLVDEAQQLGLKPQLPRTPYLFELGPGQTAEALAAWLASRYPDSWCVSSGRVFVAVVPPGGGADGQPAPAGKTRGLGLEHPAGRRGWPGRWVGRLAPLLSAGGGLARLWPRRTAPVTPADPQPLSVAGDALAPSQRRRPRRTAQPVTQGPGQGRQRPTASQRCAAGANTTGRAKRAPTRWASTATACATAWNALPN